MSFRITASLLLLLLNRTLLAQVGDDIPPCSNDELDCSVHVYGETIRVGEPILAEVVCENRSDEDVQFKRPFTFKSGTVWFEIKSPGAKEFKSVYTASSGLGDVVYDQPIVLEPHRSMVCRSLLVVQRLRGTSTFQFLLDRPGEYELRARILLTRGRCYSELTTFVVQPVANKTLEEFIRDLPMVYEPENSSLNPGIMRLYRLLSVLSTTGVGSEENLHDMRQYLSDAEGYQLPLMMGEIRLHLNSRDEEKRDQGLSKLAQIRKDSKIGPFWKNVASEVYAYELARSGRDAEARAVLRDIKHESELTGFAKARLAQRAEAEVGTSTQPAQSDAP